MAVYKNMKDLKAALEDKLVTAANNMSNKIKTQVDLAVSDYYDDYKHPKMYPRTGNLSEAPVCEEARLNGDAAVASVYMDLGIQYHRIDDNLWRPATMEEVIEWAENKTHGGFEPQRASGVQVWTRPMDEVKAVSREMWKDALQEAGLSVK